MTPSSPNFDPVARIYRWAEYAALGPLLQRTRTCLLPHLASCRQALVLGDGDGRFLAELLRTNPTLHAIAVDTSARMLHLLRQRCAPSSGRLQTLHLPAHLATPPPHTDLIVTNFFLDCLPQLEVDILVASLAAQLPPRTLWLLADFAYPTGPLLRPLGRLYIRALYLAFRLLTGLRVRHLPDPQSALHANNFRLLHRRSFLAGLLYAELWQLTEALPVTQPAPSSATLEEARP